MQKKRVAKQYAHLEMSIKSITDIAIEQSHIT